MFRFSMRLLEVDAGIQSEGCGTVMQAVAPGSEVEFEMEPGKIVGSQNVRCCTSFGKTKVSFRAWVVERTTAPKVPPAPGPVERG